MKIYRDLAISQIPRILGLGDRDCKSETFGCFDRYFWHYGLIDFPNVRFQELSLLLSLLYKNKFEGNIYFQKPKLLSWINAAVDFWFKILNRDGSANESYPFERSFCATSFSTYAATESCLLVGNKDVSQKIEKTGNWLSSHNNMAVANQVAASILAIYNIYLITKDDKYRQTAENRLNQLLDSQHKEGYFSEYGGFDIGYSTITLSLLAKYYKKNKSQKLRGALIRCDEFLKKYIDDSGGYDSNLGTRKTQFIYPYGLAVLKSDIINAHIRGLEENKIINPAWMDDRYCIQLTTDFLEAYLEIKNVYDKF